jgi:hypothetical protein
MKNTSRNGNPCKLFPVRFNDAGVKVCRFCGGELTGRRTAWCKDECHTAAMIVCYPSFARAAVERRDKGVCSICGIDTEKLRRRFYNLVQKMRRSGGRLCKRAEKLGKEARKRGWPYDWYNSRSWWDADHITPVVEGGGGTGLENYRTLCVPCHKAETAALAARRARTKRPQIEFGFTSPQQSP